MQDLKPVWTRRFILVVEKDTVFQRLLDEGILGF